MDEIEQVLGKSMVADVERKIGVAYITAKCSANPDAATAALERLIVMMLASVIAAPSALESADVRAEACADLLTRVVNLAVATSRGKPPTKKSVDTGSLAAA